MPRSSSPGWEILPDVGIWARGIAKGGDKDRGIGDRREGGREWTVISKGLAALGNIAKFPSIVGHRKSFPAVESISKHRRVREQLEINARVGFPGPRKVRPDLLRLPHTASHSDADVIHRKSQ